MRSLRTLIILVALLILVSSNIAAAEALLDAAKAIDWTVQNINSLNQVFANKQAVNSFVVQLYGEEIVVPTVGDYALVDLNNNGTIQLVTTLDFSGRGFFTTVYVVKKAGNQFQTSELWAPPVSIEDLKSRIVDLHKDGRKEILVPRALAPYAGATPIPIVSDVHEWDGEKLVKVNAKYKDYYANKVLPRLQKELTKAGQDQTHQGTQLREKYSKEIEEVYNILKQ